MLKHIPYSLSLLLTGATPALLPCCSYHNHHHIWRVLLELPSRSMNVRPLSPRAYPLSTIIHLIHHIQTTSHTLATSGATPLLLLLSFLAALNINIMVFGVTQQVPGCKANVLQGIHCPLPNFHSCVPLCLTCNQTFSNTQVSVMPWAYIPKRPMPPSDHTVSQR